MSSSADPKLPQDVVVVEILKRLPVESLFRCRCVSRSWRSTIDDPRFVALHLNHSALDASKWYLLRLDLWHPVQRLCSLLPNPTLALPSQSQIEIPFVNPPNRYSFVGSCNGSICVKEYPENGNGRTMYLWNLFTRKHKAVPRPGPRHHFSLTAEALGFGFDARSNDYKILRILYSLDNNGGCLGGTMPQVGIYSLSTDSWRSLECEVPAFCGYRHACRRPIFLNGNLHWFPFKLDDLGVPSGYRSIILFDVAGEVFDEMAPPEEISRTHDVTSVMSVAILNDLLAVLVSFKEAVARPEPRSVCSVWVMREYGVAESWTKLYSFEPWGVVSGFDGFTRNGELLMEIDGGDRVSWNPITGQYADLSLPVECHLVNVVESLDSL